MVCPVKIIVFQNLRSFFTFSGPELSYNNYRIIVHLATLANISFKLQTASYLARVVPGAEQVELGCRELRHPPPAQLVARPLGGRGRRRCGRRRRGRGRRS